VQRALAQVRGWASTTRLADGRRVIDQAWVRADLARVRAEIEFLAVLNAKLATAVDNGTLRAADASAAKVYGSELMMRANRVLQGVVGPDVALDADSPGAVSAAAWPRAPVPGTS
jgi:alkylation response protein AidB-like acyl-CoA dehydrogenase